MDMAVKTIVQSYHIDREMFQGDQTYVELYIQDFMDGFKKYEEEQLERERKRRLFLDDTPKVEQDPFFYAKIKPMTEEAPEEEEEEEEEESSSEEEEEDDGIPRYELPQSERSKSESDDDNYNVWGEKEKEPEIPEALIRAAEDRSLDGAQSDSEDMSAEREEEEASVEKDEEEEAESQKSESQDDADASENSSEGNDDDEHHV